MNKYSESIESQDTTLKRRQNIKVPVYKKE